MSCVSRFCFSFLTPLVSLEISGTGQNQQCQSTEWNSKLLTTTRENHSLFSSFLALLLNETLLPLLCLSDACTFLQHQYRVHFILFTSYM